MWWLWPHLRRLWAAAGAVAVGLIVTWLYSLSSRQALPDFRIVADFVHDYWLWFGLSLLALAIASVVAERAYRTHEARAPRPLRIQRDPLRMLLAWLGGRPRSTRAITAAPPDANPLPGREAELVRLAEWFAQAESGNRRVVFISGEPGAGKTTLVRAFLDSVAHGAVRIARGQCVEQHGPGEPYMPVLDALTRLCREPGGARLLAILHRLAPAWLAQMPSLVSVEDRARLHSQAQGTTQARMLREIVEAFEAMAAEAPLVLTTRGFAME